jgi:mRNA interferase RelE/StbE
VYRIDVRPAADRALRRLRGPIRRRVEGAILLLASDPRPPAAVRLVNSPYWRVRIGDYRVIYAIQDDVLVVVVVTVGHRREVYRG